MKKKIMQALGVAAATLGAFGLAVGTTPAGQDVLTAAQQTQVSQRQNGKVNHRSQQQQTQQRQAQKATYRAPQGTLPEGDGMFRLSQLVMTPKQYGTWLLMTGKNKYNDRRNKRWAKGRA